MQILKKYYNTEWRFAHILLFVTAARAHRYSQSPEDADQETLTITEHWEVEAIKQVCVVCSLENWKEMKEEMKVSEVWTAGYLKTKMI